MIVNYIKDSKTLILKIEEEIDHHTSEKIKRRSDYEIEIHIPKKIIFDLENVSFMDSSGIGLLIGRYKLVKMLGRKSKYYKHKTTGEKSVRNERSFKVNTNRKYGRDKY